MQKRMLFCLAILCFTLLLAVPASTQVSTERSASLSNHDRQLLAEVQAQGRADIMVLIVAIPGDNPKLAADIQKLEGKIRFRDDDLNYIRAIVPVGQVESVASLTGVQAIKVDELVTIDDPALDVGPEIEAILPPGPSTPKLNPYMPTQDIGAPQFVQANPGFDGRGVKVGIVDTGVDLLTTELQSAKLLDGTPVRKIIDWVNMNDPLDPASSDPSWINMQTQVPVSGGSFTVNSTIYTGAPQDGVYRFGIFDEGKISADSISQNSEYAIKIGSTWCADLNRNGVCHETFAVLWRASDNTVWVDSNADRSFAGEKAMTDYQIKYDIGLFGTDNPATPVRESVPFVVQTDGRDKYVNIGVVGAAHATHVAGIAAGKGFFGGAFDGAAAEAQIVSVRACLFSNSCTLHGMLEGMIYASKQANVDVINMSIGGLSALNDGRSVFSILYDRLIDQTKAQMFLSAGNAGPSINTVGDPSITSNVMSIGASVTKDTWLNNWGVVAAFDDGLFNFSSRGPTEAGGFKPNIVAPGCAISSIPAWQTGGAPPYPLPPGYALFAGTSMAAPEATGGAALLISAAKQTGTQYKPDQLRKAINSSARFLTDYGAHEQGNGLFQVGSAWNLLRINLRADEITSEAPVETVLSDYLEVPHTGTGIYQREGWTAGDSRVLNLKLTRKSGGSKPILYNLLWIGNDGTFSSGGFVSLPRDIPVSVPVTVHPQTAGVHSAILNLVSEDGEGVDYQLMNTVVAADQFTSLNGYSVSWSGNINRPEKSPRFVNVPANVNIIKFDLSAARNIVRLWVAGPDGLPYGYIIAGASAPTTVYLTNPAAGVWEITAESATNAPSTPVPFSAAVTLYGVSISPTSWTIDPATVSAPYNQTFNFTNNFAAFTGGSIGFSPASVYRGRLTISAQPQYFDIMVPSGAYSLTARTSNPSDPSANIDLYLYDCTAGADKCLLKMSGTSLSASEYVSASNPVAGLWRIKVVPTTVPSGTVAIDYFDSISYPNIGFISTGDSITTLRSSGMSWSRLVTAVAFTSPASGRFLQGQVVVLGRIIGSSFYQIKAAEVNLMVRP